MLHSIEPIGYPQKIPVVMIYKYDTLLPKGKSDNRQLDIIIAGKSPGRIMFAHRFNPDNAPLNAVCGIVIIIMKAKAAASLIKIFFDKILFFIIKFLICDCYIYIVKKM